MNRGEIVKQISQEHKAAKENLNTSFADLTHDLVTVKEEIEGRGKRIWSKSGWNEDNLERFLTMSLVILDIPEIGENPGETVAAVAVAARYRNNGLGRPSFDLPVILSPKLVNGFYQFNIGDLEKIRTLSFGAKEWGRDFFYFPKQLIDAGIDSFLTAQLEENSDFSGEVVKIRARKGGVQFSDKVVVGEVGVTVVDLMTEGFYINNVVEALSKPGIESNEVLVKAQAKIENDFSDVDALPLQMIKWLSEVV